MSDSLKKPVPGGRVVVGAKPYCEAWRKYAEPVAQFMGWKIHSFGTEVKFVSEDYKFTQSMGIPFIEDLYKAIQKANKCKPKATPSSSSEPSFSEESRIQQKCRVLRPSSTDKNTWTFDMKAGSSKRGT